MATVEKGRDTSRDQKSPKPQVAEEQNNKRGIKLQKKFFHGGEEAVKGGKRRTWQRTK